MTIAINTSQMNIVELMTPDDFAGTSLGEPAMFEAYREMVVPAGPGWVEEHVRRLSANGIQPHFQLATHRAARDVERMIRRGDYTGPLNLTWVAIGGGFDAPNPYNMMDFIRQVPDGAVLTLESIMRNVLPLNMMAIAMGLHVRCGNEDNLWAQERREDGHGRAGRAARAHRREFGRDIATGKEAREVYKLDEHYSSAEETIAKIGFPPGRKAGQVGFTFHA